MKKHTIALPSGDTFSPDKTFNCGQCFRFHELQDGWQGVVGDDVVFFPKEQPSGKIEYFSHNGIDLCRFLDSDTSYSDINEVILTAFDGDTASVIENAVELSSGLRILRQNFWEALCSFIISQNNNIPRIKKNVAAISARYGERIENTDFYSFPSPEALIEAGDKGLNDCRLGFRTKYILHACHMLISEEITENKLSSLSDTEAKTYLMQINGVGPKVASCALLYGAHRLSEIPVDVWMKKVFNRYFGSNFADLGEYGGVLQQYLFFRERFIIEGKKV